MKTIKEYAESKSVSYEAVRQKIKKYRKELEGHIFKKGRTQFLDDTAMQLLDEHSVEKPVIVYDAQKDEEILKLREENKQLQQHIITIQGERVKTQEQLQMQTLKNHALEMEKLQIESAKEQTEKKIQRLRDRRLTFKERITGRLHGVDAE